MNIKKDHVLWALILLGLIAIGVSAYSRYGVPYLRERHLETLDQERITDLNSLNLEVIAVLKKSPRTGLGNPDTVYVSLPSASPDCSDLNLPSLPVGWNYNCVATSTLQNANGLGWLPVDFQKYATSTVPLLLPTDPVNNTNHYYTFVVDGTKYVLTAGLTTKKYIDSVAETDGGYDPLRYETGSDFGLWAQALGLVFSFPYEPNATSTPLFPLDYPNQQIQIGNLDLTTKSLVVTTWVDLKPSTIESYELIDSPGAFVLYAYDSHPTLDVLGSVYDATGKQIVASNLGSTAFDQWHQIGLFYGYMPINGQNTLVIASIIDGSIINPTTVSSPENLAIGSIIINKRETYQGTIGDVRIYDTPLTASDIQNDYSLESSLLFGNQQ